MNLLRLSLAAAMAVLLAVPVQAFQIILDAELDQAFNKLAAPVRPALPGTAQTRIMLVNDPSFNAFAVPDNIIFLHSGLIHRTTNQEELRGVIAHELAHVSSNHFIKGEAAMGKARLGVLGGMLAGMGAAIAGAPQAGMAIMTTSQAAGISGILQYTRVQEQEADQAARQALAAANISTDGMVTMFEKLRTESQLSYDTPPPYLLTHPQPASRRSSIQGGLATQVTASIEPTEDFLRLQAKVFALTNTPATTLRTYGEDTFAGRYARVFAVLRQGKVDEARKRLASLKNEKPDDPWLQDLEASMAMEQGKPEDALTIWQNLLRQHPNHPILMFQTAEAARAANQLDTAGNYYRATTRLWPDWSEAWYGYGLVLGKQNRLVESHLALTEAHLAAGDKKSAKASLALARHYAKDTAPAADTTTWLTALQSRLED